MSNLDDKQLEINVMGRDYKEMCLRDRYRLEALWMLLIIEFDRQITPLEYSYLYQSFRAKNSLLEPDEYVRPIDGTLTLEVMTVIDRIISEPSEIVEKYVDKVSDYNEFDKRELVSIKRKG